MEYTKSDNNFNNFISKLRTNNIHELNANLRIILHDPTKTYNYYSICFKEIINNKF